MNVREQVDAYLRAANYLAAAQIYLKDNFLLERPLVPEDIKPRLLGHWGTAPGINLLYANLQELIRRTGSEWMFVLGPGHGYAALQANLFIEGSLEAYYPRAKRNADGVGYVVKGFSWPEGFPSHSNPGTPGVILEGGELGYSLATAYGAALDNPDLIVACLVGDGEAETGPTAAAWHLNKLVDPSVNGAVLPILHLNGYKISGPTLFGRMSDEDLRALFSGYGYEPLIVDGTRPGALAGALDRAYGSIRRLQRQARRPGRRIGPARFPMIALRTPKGWTGIKRLGDLKVEGNFPSHQVVAPDVRENPASLKALEQWLRSYRFEELFHPKKGFAKDVLAIVPPASRQMARNPHALGGPPAYRPLRLPDPKAQAEPVPERGMPGEPNMRQAGRYLKEVFRITARSRNFRLFSPDEIFSNRLDDVLTETGRAFTLPTRPWDVALSPDGRVMEMLSEHSLQGLAQGYTLTGRHAVFASYEAFVQIIASMADQYAKFLKGAEGVRWRGDVPSLTYMLTSSSWRQEHNGFSHQNPGFIDDMLVRHADFINLYFPVDGNATLATLERALATPNGINVIVTDKKDNTRWQTLTEARRSVRRGLATWDFASHGNPDVVVASVGDYMTKEALAAIDYVRRDAPRIKMRYVNVLTLSDLGFGPTTGRVPQAEFERHFTRDRPVVVNFHGYPQSFEAALYGYGVDPKRFQVHGYQETGTTTTPFDMHVRNRTSRWHLAQAIVDRAAERGSVPRPAARRLHERYARKLRNHHAYILRHGDDPEEITGYRWGHLGDSS